MSLCIHTSLCIWIQLCTSVCDRGYVPEPITEMGFNTADSMASPPGIKPQKLFNFPNFTRKKEISFTYSKTI